MRRMIALRKTIATHPRMIAALAATVAGCLALLMTFVWGLVGASPASAASTTYAIQDLGNLGAPGILEVNDINDSGQVVGNSTIAPGATHAFLYSDGQMQDLNTLIPADSGWILTDAMKINNSGQIVGEGYRNGQGPQTSLYLASPDGRPRIRPRAIRYPLCY